MKRLVFIFATILPCCLWAKPKYCPASGRSCEFYSCMENQTHCGPDGYWKKLGLHYCQKFLFREDRFSETAQQWLRASRACLQTKAQRLFAPLTCSQMQTAALDSHIGCYVDTGFCELTAQDRNQIYRYLFTALRYPEILKQAIKVGRICQDRKSFTAEAFRILPPDGL